MRNERWSKYHQTGLIGESWLLTSMEGGNQKKKTKNSILITWIEISGSHAAFMKWVINGED
jgi:hypothetical protein